jgi:beta-mannosidase
MKNQTSKTHSYFLTSGWEFKQTSSTSWLPASVPGTVHTDLLENKIIEDPFFRINEKDLQWIDKTDWEYRCTFFPEQEIFDKEVIELVFEGLDTYAEVYLNGKLILQAENMFREWKVPCKNILKKGQNELRIVLKSPITIGLEKLNANGYPLPASNDQSENGEMGDKKVSIFTRKAGYHFGWDWGPRLVTSGIWRPVKLVGFNTAKLVDVYFLQNSITEKKASFTAEVEIEANKDFSGELTIYSKQAFTKVQNLEIKKGLHAYKVNFEIEDPKLWWPNGLGEQNLYPIKTSLVNESDPRKPLLDENETNMGIRTIKLVREKDEDGKGESFYFEVNGHPVFAKGANYIPNDVFLTRFKPKDYERIVKAAADANMNMLRVWGGGIYENDIFYDLCDKYGIMVWQDFMFACSMYPGDDWFLENVRIEAEENIKRLRNHPSLSLWCGNNEIEVAWAEYEEDRGWGWKQRYTKEQRKEIWASYDTLFHKILPAEVAKLNPSVAYWHSSPSAGMGELAGDFTTSGDQHYWGVWHGQHPFSDFRKYKARFMSEYGFQSFPELNTVATYALPEEWDIESEVMAAHQRSGIGNLRIRQYMEDDYQIPEDFKEFLYVSQLLQAEGIKMAIESHRAEMPYCMGSLYWQLNDCWPVASWSGIDYFGRWKALHYFVKKAFEETILVSFEEEDQLRFYVISDKLTDQTAILKQTLIDFNGTVLWQEEKKLDISSNSSNLIQKLNLTELFTYGNPSGMVLVTDLISDENLIYEDLHYFKKPKELALQAAEIGLEIFEKDSEFEIQLTANRLAKNVFLSTNLSPDHFSDNYFDLIPGQTKKVSFPKTGTLEEFKNNLKVLHLYETMQ